MTSEADTSSDYQNKKICDGFDCNAKATKEAKVDAGKFGTLTLFLCANCIRKFENDAPLEPDQLDKQSHIPSKKGV